MNLKYEDDTPVGKGAGRSVIEKLQQTYATELANKDFAYDGEKSLFTIGALPQNINELTEVSQSHSCLLPCQQVYHLHISNPPAIGKR